MSASEARVLNWSGVLDTTVVYVVMFFVAAVAGQVSVTWPPFAGAVPLLVAVGFNGWLSRRLKTDRRVQISYVVTVVGVLVPIFIHFSSEIHGAFGVFFVCVGMAIPIAIAFVFGRFWRVVGNPK